jgi:WD40 repeat protein
MFQPLKIGKSYALDFSRCSTKLAAIGARAVVWDLKTRQKVMEARPFANINSVCFSPQADRIAVKNTSGRIAVLSVSDGAPVCDFRNAADGEGCGVLFSPCGNFTVDGSWNGYLTVREAASGKMAFSAHFPGEMITGVHCNAAGDMWVLEHSPKATSDTGPPDDSYFTVWHWPFETGKFTRGAMRVPFSSCSALSPDGTRLAAVFGAPPETLSVFDMQAGTLAATFRVVDGLGLKWSGGGALLGLVEPARAVIYRTGTWEEVRAFETAQPQSLAFSPDGSLVAISGIVFPLEG